MPSGRAVVVCVPLTAQGVSGGLDKTVHTEPPTKAKTSSVPESSPMTHPVFVSVHEYQVGHCEF